MQWHKCCIIIFSLALNVFALVHLKLQVTFHIHIFHSRHFVILSNIYSNTNVKESIVIWY